MSDEADRLEASRMLLEWGHGFYRAEARLLADDMLLRTRIGDRLNRAVQMVRDAETAHRRAHLTARTREQPVHDPRAVETAQVLERLAARLSALSARIRGAGAPDAAGLARLFRAEPGRRERLLQTDMRLIAAATRLLDGITGRSEAALSAAAGEIAAGAAVLEAMAAERGRLLGGC